MSRELTPEQLLAVAHRGGSACVVAGAGTGKTTALVGRIVYLVEHEKVDPHRILVTTFTRKATAELYQRAHEELGDAAHRLVITTIDSHIFHLAEEAAQERLVPFARPMDEAEHRLLLLEAAWETFGKEAAWNRERWSAAAGEARLVNLLEDCIRAELATGKEGKALKKTVQEKLLGKTQSFYFDIHEVMRRPTYPTLTPSSVLYKATGAPAMLRSRA